MFGRISAAAGSVMPTRKGVLWGLIGIGVLVAALLGAIAGWSQIFAALALAPFMPFASPTAAVTPLLAANVLMLAIFCSSIAYVLYYRLIADIGPTRALTMAFLMPAFGMLWGALFLDEPITLPMIAGCALIIGGATAVLRPAPAKPRQ